MIERLRLLSIPQIGLGLVVVSALVLAMEDRKVSLLPLLVQYLLLSALYGQSSAAHILIVRLGIGVAICVMLYLTTRQVERRHQPEQVLPVRFGQAGHAWRDVLQNRPFEASIGPIFRLLALFLGGLLAYALWKAYPFPMIPSDVGLLSYWLISIGLLLVMTSLDPLRIGFGLLTMANGFESAYLFLEQSLIVMALVGAADIVLALAIVISAERWLASLREERSA